VKPAAKWVTIIWSGLVLLGVAFIAVTIVSGSDQPQEGPEVAGTLFCVVCTLGIGLMFWLAVGGPALLVYFTAGREKKAPTKPSIVNVKYRYSDHAQRLNLMPSIEDERDRYMQRWDLITKSPTQGMAVGEAETLITETQKTIAVYEQVQSRLEQVLESILKEYEGAGFAVPHPDNAVALVELLNSETDQAKLRVLEDYLKLVDIYRMQKKLFNDAILTYQGVIEFLESVIEKRAQGDSSGAEAELEDAESRLRRREYIPDDVKIFVWRRDEGRCVKCGSQENLEFDHIIPFSKGGNSTARNLQLLCEKCNRSKGASLA
jgi:flagellar biosynthesis chaperone FliJ